MLARSVATRSGDLARYFMVAPFSPQNVQWFLAPHQQPRELSNGSLTSRVPPSGRRPTSFIRAKNSSYSGVGSSSILPSGALGGVESTSPSRRQSTPGMPLGSPCSSDARSAGNAVSASPDTP
jgi:hypothetical protein